MFNMRFLVPLLGIMMLNLGTMEIGYGNGDDDPKTMKYRYNDDDMESESESESESDVEARFDDDDDDDLNPTQRISIYKRLSFGNLANMFSLALNTMRAMQGMGHRLLGFMGPLDALDALASAITRAEKAVDATKKARQAGNIPNYDAALKAIGSALYDVETFFDKARTTLNAEVTTISNINTKTRILAIIGDITDLVTATVHAADAVRACRVSAVVASIPDGSHHKQKLISDISREITTRLSIADSHLRIVVNHLQILETRAGGADVAAACNAGNISPAAAATTPSLFGWGWGWGCSMQ